MTFDDISIGQLRALVNYGGSEFDTVAEALAQLAQSDRAGSEHAALWGAYQAYVGLREQHQQVALEEAAQQAHQELRGKSDGERMAARRQARTDAFDHFQRAEPVLDFDEWTAAGQPEIHTVGAVRRAAAAVRELVQ